jgi:flagellar biosynthesis GTPase FlhF
MSEQTTTPGTTTVPAGNVAAASATPAPEKTQPPATPVPSEGATPDGEALGDAGKEALRKEREARRALERELAEIRKQIADTEAAKAKAAEEEAARRGEFEKLATERQAKLEKLEAERAALAQEREALAAKIAAYEERERARIERGLKDLPDDLRAFDPGPDAPLDQRLRWFETAQEVAARRIAQPVPGHGPAPQPVQGDPKAAEEARRRQWQLARAF